VPADLTVEQSQAVAAVMLAIHDDFRQRHGLPPLPTAWALDDHLQGLRDRALLTDPALLGVSGSGVGRVVSRVRLLLWQALKPLLFRQSEVNRDVVLVLEALARDHEHARHTHRALSSRIADLETQVADLWRRLG
jgi:hypothetical protein